MSSDSAEEHSYFPPDLANSTEHVEAAGYVEAAAPIVKRSCRICSAPTPKDIRTSFTLVMNAVGPQRKNV
jgi:hypothetical protein